MVRQEHYVFGINWLHITTRNATGMFDQPEAIISRSFVENVRDMASVRTYYATWHNVGVSNRIAAANFGEKIAVILILKPRVSPQNKGIR
jgi:hypothetical protein